MSQEADYNRSNIFLIDFIPWSYGIFISTVIMVTYHHSSCVFGKTSYYDQIYQLLMTSQLFSPTTPNSSTNKITSLYNWNIGHVVTCL